MQPFTLIPVTGQDKFYNVKDTRKKEIIATYDAEDYAFQFLGYRPYLTLQQLQQLQDLVKRLL